MLGWKIFGAGLQSGLANAICQDAATSIVAAGTTQGTATELSAATNAVTSVAAGAGCILSGNLAAGDEQAVYNAGANPLKIYPTSGFNINQLAANTAMSLPVNTGCIFKCVSATQVFVVVSA